MSSKNKQKRIKVGGRSIKSLAFWQKLLIGAVVVGLVGFVSMYVYSQLKERDLIARAAKFTKVDIHSRTRSSARVTFSACKQQIGSDWQVTILATKSSKVKNAKVKVQVYKFKDGKQKFGGIQKASGTWWGDEVTALQLNVSKTKNDQLVFFAESNKGVSRPKYTKQPKRSEFKKRSSYETAKRKFKAATVNPKNFVYCNEAEKAPQVAESICLSRGRATETISGLQKGPARRPGLGRNTVIDARRAYWDGTDKRGRYIPWTITVDGASPACWYGGKYTGAWDDRSRSISWSEHYHHAGAFSIRSSNFLVEGYRAHNQGDGIRMEGRGGNFHIKDVYLSDIHDDCVENDYMHGGITEDSLFDGCYTGFSARGPVGNTRNGSKNTWIIRNNLMRMKPFSTMYRPDLYGNYGYAMLFKWNAGTRSPALSLENNIFMADRRPSVRPRDGLELPPNVKLKSCKNNTFVWLGSGEFPYKLPSCFKITKDRSVWNNAVAQWKKEHPTIR